MSNGRTHRADSDWRLIVAPYEYDRYSQAIYIKDALTFCASRVKNVTVFSILQRTSIKKKRNRFLLPWLTNNWHHRAQLVPIKFYRDAQLHELFIHDLSLLFSKFLQEFIPLGPIFLDRLLCLAEFNQILLMVLMKYSISFMFLSLYQSTSRLISLIFFFHIKSWSVSFLGSVVWATGKVVMSFFFPLVMITLVLVCLPDSKEWGV